MASNDLYFVPTKAAHNSSEYSCVVFTKPIKKVAENKSLTASGSEKKSVHKTLRQLIQEKKEFNKERRKEMVEIHNFSKSNLTVNEKFHEDVKRIVQLGAVPKREHLDYTIFKKQLQKQKKKLDKPGLTREGANQKKAPALNKQEKKIQRKVNNKKGMIGGMLAQYGKITQRKPNNGRMKRR